MNFRTDLAIERREVSPHADDGLKIDEFTKEGVKITSITVLNEIGERSIGKPKGKYITIEAKNSFDGGELIDKTLFQILCDELTKILPKGSAIVCGIGNRNITPDALGPDLKNYRKVEKLCDSVKYGEERS